MEVSKELRDEVSQMMAKIRPELKNRWFHQYEKAWMYKEIIAALDWCAANPKRKPKKNWGQFLNNWFRNATKYLQGDEPKKAIRPNPPVFREPMNCENCHGDGYVSASTGLMRCYCEEGNRMPPHIPQMEKP